jgi:hypothetical protein
MNGIAAKIAVEIRVFFQNNDVHSGPREQITSHHARRPAADNEATNADVR